MIDYLLLLGFAEHPGTSLHNPMTLTAGKTARNIALRGTGCSGIALLLPATIVRAALSRAFVQGTP